MLLPLLLAAGLALADDGWRERALARIPEELLAEVMRENRENFVTLNAEYRAWYRCNVCQSLLDDGNRMVQLEKEKAKVAGVVNKAALYEGQQHVVAGRRCLKHADPPTGIPCGSKRVLRVDRCLSGEHAREPWCLTIGVYAFEQPTADDWYSMVDSE